MTKSVTVWGGGSLLMLWALVRQCFLQYLGWGKVKTRWYSLPSSPPSAGPSSQRQCRLSSSGTESACAVKLSLQELQCDGTRSAPVHQTFHLLSVGRVIVITDKANYCCVFWKLQNVVISITVGHQVELQRTQDDLRGAGAQGDDIGGVVVHLHRMGSVGEEVKQPATQRGAETKGGQFVH